MDHELPYWYHTLVQGMIDVALPYAAAVFVERYSRLGNDAERTGYIMAMGKSLYGPGWMEKEDIWSPRQPDMIAALMELKR